jgi:hypothetical protein
MKWASKMCAGNQKVHHPSDGNAVTHKGNFPRQKKKTWGKPKTKADTWTRNGIESLAVVGYIGCPAPMRSIRLYTHTHWCDMSLLFTRHAGWMLSGQGLRSVSIAPVQRRGGGPLLRMTSIVCSAPLLCLCLCVVLTGEGAVFGHAAPSRLFN